MNEKGLKMVGKDLSGVAVPVSVDENGNIKTITEGSKVKIGQEQPINITAHPVGYLELEREVRHLDEVQQITSIGIDGVPYGWTTSRIFRTYDGYLTPEHGETISNLGSGVIVMVTKTKYGYLVVREKSVWFSSSFESGYTKTLETDERGNFIQMNSFIHNTEEECVILLGEYAHGSFVPGKSRRVFLSMDGGQTFNIIDELPTPIDVNQNHHYHTAIFDPYDRRIWVSIGDGLNDVLKYSDDLGENWHIVEATFENSHQQPTGIIAFPDRVALLPDRQTPPSIFSFQKDRYYNLPNVSNLKLEYTYGLLTHTQSTANTTYSFRPIAQKGIEAYFTVPGDDTTANPKYPLMIVGTGDGGKTWHKLWTKSGGRSSRTGIIGPDKHGRLYCQWLSQNERVTFVFKKPKWQLSTIQNIENVVENKILSRKTLNQVGNRRYGQNITQISLQDLNESIPTDFSNCKTKKVYIENNADQDTSAVRFYKAYKTSKGWFIDPTFHESDVVLANSKKMFTSKDTNLSWLDDEDVDGLVVGIQYGALGTGDFLIEFIGKI